MELLFLWLALPIADILEVMRPGGVTAPAGPICKLSVAPARERLHAKT